jgi:hypothetical protein
VAAVGVDPEDLGVPGAAVRVGDPSARTCHRSRGRSASPSESGMAPSVARGLRAEAGPPAPPPALTGTRAVLVPVSAYIRAHRRTSAHIRCAARRPSVPKGPPLHTREVAGSKPAAPILANACSAGTSRKERGLRADDPDLSGAGFRGFSASPDVPLMSRWTPLN